MSPALSNGASASTARAASSDARRLDAAVDEVKFYSVIGRRGRPEGISRPLHPLSAPMMAGVGLAAGGAAVGTGVAPPQAARASADARILAMIDGVVLRIAPDYNANKSGQGGGAP